MTNKKAIVVGGSNGIGLSIALQFLNRGYLVEIVDVQTPDAALQAYGDKVFYRACNLMNFDETLFEELANEDNVEALMITAGLGRVADFEYLDTAEIEKLIRINTTAGIKIVSKFYSRIKSDKRFYCGMMGSIAGLVSSPMFSVYAASKAAICRFIESVNIELEVFGTQNRILNVSPGSIKGTKFNGGEQNSLDMTEKLAGDIVDKLFEQEEMFIPDYDTVYKNVLDRYRSDAHAFGLNSYEYKQNSGRKNTEKKTVVGYLSGTFDLFHVGHLNLLQRAKEHCDYLIVGVHPDASHKGKTTFISFEERMKIVGAVRYVDKVVQSCPEDADAWDLWHYDRLFVGDDYKGSERFNKYEKYFEDKGVKIVYFPYTKGTSSTQLRSALSK